jgi:hypothetical protein
MNVKVYQNGEELSLVRCKNRMMSPVRNRAFENEGNRFTEKFVASAEALDVKEEELKPYRKKLMAGNLQGGFRENAETHQQKLWAEQVGNG